MAALAAFFGIAAASFFRSHPLPARCEVALYACVMLLLACAAAPALPAARSLAARSLHGRPRVWAPVGVWLVPYLVYAAGCGDLRPAALGRLLALCLPPLLAYRIFPVRDPAKFSWQDGVAWIWLTLAVLLRQTHGIWTVPVELDFMARLWVIGVAAWCWVFVRPVNGLGYEWTFSRHALRAAAVNFAWFAAMAIPAALAAGFAAWNPRWRGAGAFAVAFVEIFVFIAWLEELFFRGFLQSLLARTLRSPARGQLLASCAFGLSHVLLAPAPNWRYVAFASAAGWFYGAAFRQGGNLVAPSLVHALVDTAWRTWFGRG